MRSSHLVLTHINSVRISIILYPHKVSICQISNVICICLSCFISCKPLMCNDIIFYLILHICILASWNKPFFSHCKITHNLDISYSYHHHFPNKIHIYLLYSLLGLFIQSIIRKLTLCCLGWSAEGRIQDKYDGIQLCAAHWRFQFWQWIHS